MTEFRNEFPGNAFVARHYPAPIADEGNVTVYVGDQAPSVSVTASDSISAGDLIDSDQAASILKITTNNLRQMVHKGRLVPQGKDGRRNLFSRAAVMELAQSRGK